MKSKFSQDLILTSLPPSRELWGDGSDYPCIIYLPSLSSLLLNQKVDVREVLDVSRQEWVPLHFFMDDFFSGRPWALRAASAIVHGAATSGSCAALQPLFMRTVKELAGKFLNINTPRILASSRAAAATFGIDLSTALGTGERQQFYNTVRDYFEQHGTVNQTAAAMSMTAPRDNPALVAQILKIPSIARCAINTTDGATISGLNIFGKKYSMSNRWATIMSGLETERAGTAQIDSDELAQTIHHFEQILELCKTGSLGMRPAPELTADMQLNLNRLSKLISDIHDVVPHCELARCSVKLQKKFEQWKVARLLEVYDFLK